MWLPAAGSVGPHLGAAEDRRRGRPRAPRCGPAGAPSRARVPARWSGRSGRRRSPARRRSPRRTARSRASRARWRAGSSTPLLPRLAVDGLADQVGVAVVAGVLLDHVHEDPAQAEARPRPRVARRRPTRASSPPSASASAMIASEAATESSNSTAQVLGAVVDRAVPVPVAVGLPVDRGPRLDLGPPHEHVVEPVALHSARCLTMPPSVMSDGASVAASWAGVQALGLHPEGVPVVVEEGSAEWWLRRPAGVGRCAGGRLTGASRLAGALRTSAPPGGRGAEGGGASRWLRARRPVAGSRSVMQYAVPTGSVSTVQNSSTIAGVGARGRRAAPPRRRGRWCRRRGAR